MVDSAKLDESVRSILAPNTAAFDSSDAALPTASEIASASPLTPMATGIESIASYTVSGSNLDKISALLLIGDRRKAVQYALDHKLWAHAFIISSCVDSDCQKEVVTEFLRSELTPTPGNSAGVNGRESLRVAYSMFAGMGADSSKSADLDSVEPANRFSSSTILTNSTFRTSTISALSSRIAIWIQSDTSSYDAGISSIPRCQFQEFTLD